MGNSAGPTKQDWHALDVELEPDAREAVEYALMEAGALGTETCGADTGLLQVTGYFANTPGRERVRAEMLEALRIYNLPSSSVRDMTVRQLADRDWLAEWKKGWQPVEIGRFIIAPPWTAIDPADRRIVLRIEPGMAFGTGTHESTRLCLTAIEQHFAGTSFLDVGTGTGILAIAAAKLFPEAHVAACDIDADAIAIARENANANGLNDCIDFRVGSVNETTASADLVCANLTADVIVSLLPTLLNVTCGRLVLSGILSTQVEPVRRRLAECGITELEVVQDGEWASVMV